MKPRHLLDFQDDVFARLRRARRIALFLDFDGTLAVLKPSPLQVQLRVSVRQSLYRLAHSSRLMVWVVSGRRRADVCERAGVPGIRYLGLYGWEGRSGSQISPRSQQALDDVRAGAGPVFGSLRRVWLENKQFSLALHHDGANGRVALECLRKLLKPHRGRLVVVSARKVFEVIPVELGDKGKAVQGELRSAGAAALPVYLGDDSTDEPAFAALRRGITVLVGKPRQTQARYRLNGVQEVQTFLERLGAECIRNQP